jgi:hypothetical protein
MQSILDYSRSPDTTASGAIDPIFNITQITNEDGSADYPWFWTGTTHARGVSYIGTAGVYICFGRALGYMNGSWMDVHGAGAQRSDQKDGDFSSLTYVSDGYYFEGSPQGDATRSYNYVRLVRDADASSLGSLTVTLSPQGAIDAGAQWSLDNMTWYDSGYTLTGISPGTVTIYYSEVNGYTTPANGSATIVEGTTATATGTYTESSTAGTLTVTISPQGAIDAGAQWSVDGGTTWYDSAKEVTLDAAVYTLTYKTVSGYDTPTDESVTVTDGGATSTTGTYVETTGYTLNDAVILIQILTGKTDANSWQDVDNDSVATLQDVILIIRDVAGL